MCVLAYRNDNFVDFALQLVAMATSLKLLEKEGRIVHIKANTYHLVKLVKIGLADPEIICLQAIILKITKKKLTQAKHIARGAGTPRRLN